MSEKLGPAETLADAFNQLEVPLSDPESFKAFYVSRDTRRVDELAAMFHASRECLKVLFTGFRQSGKSTELFRLMFALEGTFLPVYVSADTCFERTDIDYIDVLLGLCSELITRAADEGVDINKRTREKVNDWTSQLQGEVTQVTEKGESASVEATAGIQSLLASLLAKARIERATRNQLRQVLEPRSAEVLEVIELVAADCVAALGKAPLLILDDLEKTDPVIAEGIFRGRTASLQEIACHVIFTIPISVLNTHAMQPVRRAFSRVVTLPMIAVTTQDGSIDAEGDAKIKEIVTRRAAGELFKPDALDAISAWSGGVVADALRLARDGVVAALTDGEATVTRAMVDDAARDIVLNYRRSLVRDDYPLLDAVAKTRQCDPDDQHRELLHALAILEYENNPNWYDVHPAVRALLDIRDEAANTKQHGDGDVD